MPEKCTAHVLDVPPPRASARPGGAPRTGLALRAARIIAAVLVAFVALDAAAAGGPEAAPRTVRIGVYQNKPKLFMDENGRAAGLFIDLIVAIARAEGWTPTFVPCQWSECLRALGEGRIDLMPDVAYSRERARHYSFHRTPVIESWSQLYASAGASIRTMADLDGKRVAMLRDSIQQTTFEQMISGFGYRMTIVPAESLEDAFRSVKDGAADVAVANHFFGEYFHGEYGLLRTSVVFHVAELHYVTARGRNRELLQGIDRRLDEWRREPNSTYYATLARWMDRPPVGVMPGRVLLVIGVTVGLLLLAFGVILLLRHQVRARTRHLVRANEELRAAEAALLKSESLLNSAQALSRVGGWEWDVETREVTWTEECYRIHGIARADVAPGSPELIERSIDCFEPERRAAVREAFRRCVERGESSDLEGRFTSATGAALWVRATAMAVRNASGAVVKVVGNIMDVTDRKKAEEERRLLEDQLRQSGKMEAIGKLAGGVAHDFNNQLTVILNYADLALLQVDDGDLVRKALTEVLNAGQRAAGLTRQLLAFSRKQVLELTPVNLNQMASNIQKMLGRILGADIDLQLALAPDLGLTLADPGQIDQVLMNLVINARDAMPGGGRLTIETANADLDAGYAARHVDASPGRYVQLTVSDTGCGMDEATQSHIFEPFFTTKERGKGTGLGLSIVYGIVRQLGGHISVESEPGRGTTFGIHLPRATASVALTPTAAARAARAGGTETILVVEDEEAVRELTVHVLKTAGYTVLTASNSDDALPTAAAHPGEIHLLLTDVIMPGMDGTALARELRAVRPATKVLYLSGYTDNAAVQHGVLEAGTGFIGKPFTVAQLTRSVRETLDGTETAVGGEQAGPRLRA